MVITCSKCGRPLCEVEPPSFDDNEIGRISRTIGRFGLELPPEVLQFLKPTPELIAKQFKPRCPDGC